MRMKCLSDILRLLFLQDAEDHYEGFSSSEKGAWSGLRSTGKRDLLSFMVFRMGFRLTNTLHVSRWPCSAAYAHKHTQANITHHTI